MADRKSTIKNLILWLGTIVVLLMPNPLLDPDFGWHLRTGQEIIARGEVPSSDWYSFTLPDHQWIDHEWPQDIVVATVHKYAGLTGVRVWYMFLGLIWIATILGILNQRGLNVKENSGAVAFIVACIVAALKLFRPQIVTAIGFSIVLLLIQRARSQRSADCFYLLPLVFFIWANLHGGFPIGFALLGVFFLGELFTPTRMNAELLPARELARLVFWSVAAFAVTFLNFHGAELYREIVGTISDPVARQAINEWLPLEIGALSGQLCLIAVVFLLMNIILERGRIRVGDIILLVVTGALAASSTRHVVFFIIVSAAVLIELETGYREHSEFRKGALRIVRTTLVSIAFAVMFFLPVLYFSGMRFDKDPATTYPVQALKSFSGDKSGLRLFNEYGWGGYMIMTEPQLKTFIDGRMTHWRYKKMSLLDVYGQTMDGKPIWKQAFTEFKVNSALISPQVGLAKILRESPEWRVSYEDSKSAFFLKNDNPATAE